MAVQMAGLGEALRRMRKRAHMTQAALEKKSGAPAGSLTTYENGTARPSVPTLAGILDALDSSLYDLAVMLDEVNGRAQSGDGRPRQAWADAMLSSDVIINRLNLWAFAQGISLSGEPSNWAPDFIATVADVGKRIAERVVKEVMEGRPA